MGFNIPSKSSADLNTPESLFRDLRSRKVEGLLSHQADILREYVNKALQKPDVAFQMPTGSGKTLVGLLLGEWRRRKFEERVVYLCPTNQLVNQVVAQAKMYGIDKIHGFTGKIKDYDRKAQNDYLNADSVAVTSYSALFNTNPFFDSPHIIILDDAHSAENYIASSWTLQIGKREHQTLFSALTSILQQMLPPSDYQRLADRSTRSQNMSPWDKTWVEKIATPTFSPCIPELMALLDTSVVDSDLRHPWSLIRDHLDACHLYVSADEILIRPLMPPTNTHHPFEQAKQRVYMSATLGEGGELERLSGRKSITRLQTPTGWDRQGIGRRLFFFPQSALKDEESEQVVLSMLGSAGRSLVIVPDDASVARVSKMVRDRLGFALFTAQEIEKSKDPFIANPQAVAVVANRYDGIDFPNDTCRLLVLSGLPRATNLQERFFINGMGAVVLYNDRILTRIVQAFGRCTRSATDYAAVVIWDEKLHHYLLDKDRRDFLHPELQAELKFGIDQSKDRQVNDFRENLTIFLGQTDEWKGADAYIVSLRADLEQKQLPGTAELRKAVQYEIDYQYALWRGDFPLALECCRRVLGELTHADMRGYRALWLYLAGSAAWLAHKEGLANLGTTARDYYRQAMSAARGIRWLAKLAASSEDLSVPTADQADVQALMLIERLESVLESLGAVHDRKYAAEEARILEGLAARDHAKFEPAHEALGRMLGFAAGNKETNGSPDPWWIVDDTLCFIFEDHSNAEATSSLDVTKARQVSTHPNWVRDNLPVSAQAVIEPVLITPVKKADDDAIPHLHAVSLWDLDEFRQWATNALAVIRELRRTFPGPGDLAWRATAIERYVENHMDPQGLLAFLRTRPADTLLTS